MERRYIIIGMDDGAEPRFSAEVMAEVAAARVFSGGRRHRERVGALLPDRSEWIDVTVPIDRVFEQYERREGTIVIFASGDPLFFGLGATLLRRNPDADIRIFPTLNSLQTLAHRVKMPYDDMTTVSLTGRPWEGLDRALIGERPKIGILTDRVHTPAAIARRLIEYGYTGYRMTVGERLGSRTDERVAEYSLAEAADSEFAMPNCVILHGRPRRHPLGLPDSEFALLDGRANMITKMPVRLLSLSTLGLERREVLWDVGSCTGSVSVEARLRFPHLAIHAFEVRPEGRGLLEANARRFGAPGIEFHEGDFLAHAPEAFPAPDALFLGGYGGRMEAFVARIAAVLRPGGVAVFNSVSDASRDRFLASASASGLEIVHINRITVDDHNPIAVIQAIKKA